VEKLGEILRHDVKGDMEAVEEEVRRGVLASLPRERLVEEILKIQKMGDEARGGSAKAESKKAESKKASIKAPSRAKQSVKDWAAEVIQPTTAQDDGFKPDKAASVKSAKPASNNAWPQAGGAAGGFKPDSVKAVSNKGWGQEGAAGGGDDGWAQAREETTGQAGGFTAEAGTAANGVW
jgi:hypothetical protein